MREESMDGVPMALLLAIGLAVLACAAPTAAQTVQKCIAADGHVTLTSGGCADGQVLAGTYDAVPEPTATAATAGLERQRQQARPPPRAKVATRGKPAPNRCQAARNHREQTLRRVGLKRTFDLLRKLDDQVWEACR